jgi:hypothetical protein
VQPGENAMPRRRSRQVSSVSGAVNSSAGARSVASNSRSIGAHAADAAELQELEERLQDVAAGSMLLGEFVLHDPGSRRYGSARQSTFASA